MGFLSQLITVQSEEHSSDVLQVSLEAEQKHNHQDSGECDVNNGGFPPSLFLFFLCYLLNVGDLKSVVDDSVIVIVVPWCSLGSNSADNCDVVLFMVLYDTSDLGFVYLKDHSILSRPVGRSEDHTLAVIAFESALRCSFHDFAVVL